MLGIDMRKAYKEKDRKNMELLKEKIEICASEIPKLKEQRRKIWFNECKVFGFEVLDIRIGGVWVRLNSAVQRIEFYLNGEVERLEELEEPMLIYNEDKIDKNHKLCMENFWQNIVSAGNIAGI